jgi:beta-xylosidase
MFNSGNLGFMRMYCVLLPEGHRNHWETPHLFLQKFPAPVFSATTKVDFQAQQDGDRTGLIIMGKSYASLVLEKSDGELLLSQVVCDDAEHGGEEKILESVQAESSTLYLKVSVSEGAVCKFSYSFDGKRFKDLGQEFTAVPGKWIGAKVGLFASSTVKTTDSGHADYDWFRIE